MIRKTHHYYFYDEVNNDFANNGINTKETPEDYVYYSEKWSVRILTFFTYYFILFIAGILWFFLRVPIHNSKVLNERRDKKKGYYVYANHTSWMSDVLPQPLVSFPKKAYTICNSDAISIKGFSGLIHAVGATPLPSRRKTYKAYLEALDKMYEDGNPVVIFPEAHIWPKYNKIRKFPSGSFIHPVRHNAASYARTLVYKKDAKGHTKAAIYYDGPFYPDAKLSRKEASVELRNRVYEAMVERAAESELDINYRYIRVETPEEVRSEIFR